MAKTVVLNDWPYFGDTTRIVPMRKQAFLYIRFGHFGKERSFNHAVGEYEQGLSVYSAELVDGVVRPKARWHDDISDAWHILEERTQYALTGRRIGEGSDGEPVLAVSSVVIRGILGKT